MTTTPFISEVVEEFRSAAISYKQQHYGDESLGLDTFAGFLRQKLTAVYERGRADAVQHVQDHWICANDGEESRFQRVLKAALTTEGK